LVYVYIRTHTLDAEGKVRLGIGVCIYFEGIGFKGEHGVGVRINFNVHNFKNIFIFIAERQLQVEDELDTLKSREMLTNKTSSSRNASQSQ